MDRAPRPDSITRRRLLIASGDPDTRSLYSESFRQTGFDVVEAIDGRDALVKALVREPALVVTEARLPFIDGYALCELLRRDSTTRSVPIVVITSESRDEVVDRARRAGADAVLVKPAPLESVIAEVMRLLKPAAETSPGHATDTGAHDAAPSPEYPQRRTDKRGPVTAIASELPPTLRCPSCDTLLRYERSHVGGVGAGRTEQWDYFVCPRSCGTYQYRSRTRRLRRMN